jgi:hypothetical protein
MSRNSGVYATLWQEGIHRSKWIAIDTNRSISENIRFCTSYLRLGKEPSLMRIHIIQLQFLPYYNKRSKLLQCKSNPKNGDIGAIKLCMGLFIIQHRLPSAQKELRSPLRYGKF